VFGTTLSEPIPQASVLPPSTSLAWMLALPMLSSWTVMELQSAVGAILSCTVTVAVQLELLPAWSVTVSVTVFVPTFAHVNVFGATVSDAMPQLSLLPPSTWLAVMLPFPVLSSWTVTAWQIAVGVCPSTTVTLKEHVAVLPVLSVAVAVTVVVPAANVLPEAGLLTIVSLPQLSEPVTLNVTTALQLFKSLVWVISDGHVMTGFCPSTTVTVNEQVAELPLTSVTVLVTVVVPALNVLPEAGFDTIEDTEQLSVPVTLNVTTAVQLFKSLFWVMFEGHVMTGFCPSTTVTVNEQVAEFPLISVAVLVTVVVPTLNVLPEAGLDTTEETVQLSVAVAENVTTALQLFKSVVWVILDGHVTTGF